MLLQEHWTPSQLTDLFQSVHTDKPAYAHICSFFKELFILQETAIPACHPPALEVDPDLSSAQRQGGLPLFQRESLTVDWPCADKLFDQLSQLALNANEQLAGAATDMINKVQSQTLNLTHCGTLMLKQDAQAFEQEARELGIQPDVLAFFVYHSLYPSVAVHLHEFKKYLPGGEEWNKGYCPFCGTRPMLSFLDQDGRRFLICSFCRHQWAAPRLFCPFCENQDTESLGYFFSEAENEYRVYTCRACKSYIKSIDLRQLSRPLYPLLEAIITSHLDISAQEHGYQNMTPGWLRL
jgi:FdhE protein